MQARVIATGETKSFYPTRQSGHNGYADEQGQWYYPGELDFRNGGIPIPETEYKVGSIWVACEEDGNLIAFSEKPIRCPGQLPGHGYWLGKQFRELKRTAYPQITWQSEPIECEVTIRIK